MEKYGGTSLADIERISIVAQHIANQIHSGERLIVVVSAMGDFYRPAFRDGPRNLSRSREKRARSTSFSRRENQHVFACCSASSSWSTSISLTGSQCGILTSADHGNAKITKITGERISEALANSQVAIVAGFQGVNKETKNVTTLGRGGVT